MTIFELGKIQFKVQGHTNPVPRIENIDSRNF